MPRQRPALRSTLMGALVFFLLAYVGGLLATGADLGDRVRLLRYWSLAAASTCAVAAPHVLLPDDDLALVQLLNLRPRALLARQLRCWSLVVGLLMMPCVMLAFYDPGGWTRALMPKSVHLAAHLLLIAGAGLYSLDRYAVIGPASQAWQEGQRGQHYRRALDHAPTGARPPVPLGMIPSLTATGRITGVAALFVVASAYFTQFNSLLLTTLPGLGLFSWSAAQLWLRGSVYDRYFYATNAFYAELLRPGSSVQTADAREPLSYEAVYWVPAPWRPHTWAGLLQLDRRMPLGRFIALGHLFLWILFAQHASAGAIAAYLLCFCVVKNATCYLLTTAPLAPASFHLAQQGPASWFVTRFFANLRWTLPLLLSLLGIAFFDARFSAMNALFWTLADIVLAAGTAGAFTYLHEGRYWQQFT